VDLLGGLLLGLFGLLLLDLFKHLEELLNQTGGSCWVSHRLGSIWNSQDMSHADYEALLLVSVSEALLVLEYVYQNALGHLLHLHVPDGGTCVVVESRKEDLKEVLLEAYLDWRLSGALKTLQDAA
jgi:hypothetical protein